MNAFKYGPVSALASEMIENLYKEKPVWAYTWYIGLVYLAFYVKLLRPLLKVIISLSFQIYIFCMSIIPQQLKRQKLLHTFILVILLKLVYNDSAD